MAAGQVAPVLSLERAPQQEEQQAYQEQQSFYKHVTELVTEDTRGVGGKERIKSTDNFGTQSPQSTLTNWEGKSQSYILQKKADRLS